MGKKGVSQQKSAFSVRFELSLMYYSISTIQRKREFVETQVYKFYHDENEWHLFAVTLIIIPGPLWGHDPWHLRSKLTSHYVIAFLVTFFLSQIIRKIEIKLEWQKVKFSVLHYKWLYRKKKCCILCTLHTIYYRNEVKFDYVVQNNRNQNGPDSSILSCVAPVSATWARWVWVTYSRSHRWMMSVCVRVWLQSLCIVGQDLVQM